ncbi:MAG: ABC transporter ATP-binding protein [Bacteroidota bacterium]
MSSLSLQHIAKSFRGTDAVRPISLEIRSGEFFSILGPSGCGKTTLLRMIAGFETPTAGEIVLDGKTITWVAPQFRNIGMVFQNYALFPHMTVFENVAFGLETKRLPKAETRRRVEKVLESVHLSHKIDVPVPQLSGGEQQRVAVARAIVVEPAVLLFDEPLSNLDVALREKTREEIRSIQKRTKITTVYVTHDQSEAMSLSDRIAVMRLGSVEQIGIPSELYETPASPFVAQFLGGANILNGLLDSDMLTVGNLSIKIAAAGTRKGEVAVAIKPEAIHLTEPGKVDSVRAHVIAKEYLGFITTFVLEAEGVRLNVSTLSSDVTGKIDIGASVGFMIDGKRCSVFMGQ